MKTNSTKGFVLASTRASRLHCNECGRTVKDHPESKTRHILKYHPHIPLIRIATTLFSPVALERIGQRLGLAFRRMITR